MLDQDDVELAPVEDVAARLLAVGLDAPPTRKELLRALLADPMGAFNLVFEFEASIAVEGTLLWEERGHQFASLREFGRAFDDAVAGVVGDRTRPMRDLEALVARFPGQGRALVRGLRARDTEFRRQGYHRLAQDCGRETSRFRHLAAAARRPVRPLARRRGAGRPARRVRASRGSPDDEPEHAAPVARPGRAACGWRRRR